MAENTITSIVPDIYEALDVVSRELTGLIPAVTINTSAARAGKDQNIVVDVEPAGNGTDVTPAMTTPDPTGQTSGSKTITINKSRAFEFGFVGEDQAKLQTGPGYMGVRANKIAQAIRGLANEVETDLGALHSKFSRAFGTPTTAPFGTANDYTDASNVLKILKDNGSPGSDNQLVIDTSAGANFIGKQSAVNSAGTDSMLRQGVLLDLAGMPLRESAQINTPTKGTGASYTSSAAGFAVGVTAIPLITGSGTVLAGDTVTFAGDTNKYVVTTGVAAAGTITLAEPGLRQALAASAVALTVGATAARNMAFNRSALVLVTRAPARPEEGDMASDVMIITDPRSGLALEFSLYKGYRKVRYEVALAWGADVVKPEHTAILLG
jgi:hypothetical protein